MKENMIILGNSKFVEVESKKGKISLTKNRRAFNLESKYNVDNVSKKNLTIDQASKYFDEYSKERKYNYVVISLGEGDYIVNNDVESFAEKFEKLIMKLSKKHINIVLEKPMAGIKDLNFKEKLVNLYKKYSQELTSLIEDKTSNLTSNLVVKNA